MNGNTIIDLVLSSVKFPAHFTHADHDKFAGEVASSAGRFMPESDSLEGLVKGVSFGKRSVGVKFGNHTTKAAKGTNIVYSFRLAVWLACCQQATLESVTGYSWQLDLSNSDFWKTWERVAVPTPEPATTTQP